MSKRVDIKASDHFMVGEDKQIYWDITDSAGVAQSMSGWTLSFVLRRSQNSATSALTKTPTVTTGSAAANRALLTLAAADTKNLAPGTYAYSVARTDSGYQQILAYGDFVINPVTARVA